MTTVRSNLEGAGRRVALVAARFNELIVGPLAAGARDALVSHGVDDRDIDTMWVPGAWEIPMVAAAAARSGRYDAVVALAAVIRGDTYHFEIVANHSAAGIARVAADTGVVVTNGILTVDTMTQAFDRAGGKAGNKGAEAALAALETVNLVRRISGGEETTTRT